MKFFAGMDHPHQAHRLVRACISANALRRRKSLFVANEWIMDSGAFTEVSTHGGFREPVEVYAALIRKFAPVGRLLVAVAQDFMCEPFILRRTGLTVADHQRLTIERFDALADLDLPVPILPVVQGFDPAEYSRHVRAYGDRLAPGAWVGVGSVCKRNGSPQDVANVLAAILHVRPDLRLHGFGVKQTALAHPDVVARLYSADSMAWAFNARKKGRNAHDWREAVSYAARIEAIVGGPRHAMQHVLALSDA